MDLHAVWGQRVYLAYSTEPDDKQSLLAGDTVTVDRTHQGSCVDNVYGNVIANGIQLLL